MVSSASGLYFNFVFNATAVAENDGVDGFIEDAGPNNGDGNYDAIPTVFYVNNNGEYKEFPYNSRDDLAKQFIQTRKRFQNYAKFSEATIDQILTPEELKDALVGLKRRGFDRPTIHALRAAYKAVFDGEGTRAERVQRVAEKYSDVQPVTMILDFIRAGGDRPLCLPRD